MQKGATPPSISGMTMRAFFEPLAMGFDSFIQSSWLQESG